MGTHTAAAPIGTTIVMWIVIAGIVLFRASRPQRTSVTRMWVMAGLLMIIAASVIYSTENLYHAPALEVAIAIVLGLAAGIPVGMLRGRHTQVSATNRHGVMQLGPSWATAAIYIGAFALRGAIRFVVPATSPIGTVIGDGLLAFAIGIVAATYFAVYQKYECLDHAAAV
jgi:O-antigen/teichoic acid export membrane protein